MPIPTSILLFVVCIASTAVAHTGQSGPVKSERQWSPIVTGTQLDPMYVFDKLVARYRGLTAYSDRTRIVQVTRDYQEQEPRRTETEVTCDFADGTLTVQTVASQLRRGLGLNLPMRPTNEMESLASNYDLWLLPHLALKFSEQPLDEFREGISEGFTATEAAEVTVDDKPMVHLELTSGDGLSGDYDARFDLYVDPKSMLIEHIEGRQRMPDGSDSETTFHITPQAVESTEPVEPVRLPSQTAPQQDKPTTQCGTIDPGMSIDPPGAVPAECTRPSCGTPRTSITG